MRNTTVQLVLVSVQRKHHQSYQQPTDSVTRQHYLTTIELLDRRDKALVYIVVSIIIRINLQLSNNK
jgi:hypothetical protein